MADDDRAVREKLALLEAEVKADADAQRARKEAALAKVREERAKQQPGDRQLRAEGALARRANSPSRDELRSRQAAIVTKKKPEPEPDHDDDEPADDDRGDLGNALELAGRANKVKQELARRPGKGEKSWIKSGIASMALGPVGWLYAGSFREAIPASAMWLALAAIASKIIPSFLLFPVLMVALPLSGIAGMVYAIQYNRHGGRQRLFDRDSKKQPKQLTK